MPPALIEKVSNELGRLFLFLLALARLLCGLDASLRLREHGLAIMAASITVTDVATGVVVGGPMVSVRAGE